MIMTLIITSSQMPGTIAQAGRQNTMIFGTAAVTVNL